jgi:hypothetical protein
MPAPAAGTTTAAEATALAVLPASEEALPQLHCKLQLLLRAVAQKHLGLCNNSSFIGTVQKGVQAATSLAGQLRMAEYMLIIRTLLG